MIRRLVSTEFGRFLMAGIANTGLTTALYWLLLFVGISATASFSLVYLVGIALAWWINGRYAFQASLDGKGLLIYPLVYVPSWVLGWLLLRFCLDWGIAPWLAGPMVAIAITPVSFLLNRKFFTIPWH